MEVTPEQALAGLHLADDGVRDRNELTISLGDLEAIHTDLVEDGLRAALGLGPVRAVDPSGPSRVTLPLVPAYDGGPVLMAGMTQEEIHQRLAQLQLEDDRAHAASSV